MQRWAKPTLPDGSIPLESGINPVILSKRNWDVGFLWVFSWKRLISGYGKKIGAYKDLWLSDE
jgi:hypothetical protein